ncbi:MAG TPA: hypothetical protein VF719_00115 [Abditibacteriaceae bacterium]|jgi:hypothetical protein
MNISSQDNSPGGSDHAPDKGESYEKLAFNFCKAATIILLTGRYALPIASGAAAVLYFLAYRNGKRETRCILGKPLIVGTFWLVVCCVSLYLLLLGGK